MKTDNRWPRGLPIRLENIESRRSGVDVLRGVSLAFEPGRRYVVVGPSGAGKSSLLRLLNRLVDPDAGRILVGDRPIRAIDVAEVRRNVGLVFQAPRPLPGSVADNLLYPLTVRKLGIVSTEEQQARLAEVGLDPGWLDRDAEAMSGGERQRLAIAVALAARPEILALDEPTAALDPANARRVADLLKRRSDAEGLRTIVVSHDRSIAPLLGETALRLDGGRVVDEGPVEEVFRREASS